jgi:hypothetical protein
VAEALEAAVRHEAHMVRRARLLTGLSESCIAFRRTTGGPRPVRFLTFEGGALSSASSRASLDTVPAPPGSSRDTRQRQQAFDRAAYDRLRVLTTELKRLIADDVRVVVRLGPTPALRQAELARWLRWI